MKPLEERIIAANKDLKEIADWLASESAKVGQNLAKNPDRKLDGSRKAYAYIYEEFDTRFKELYRKYNLPPDTKLSLLAK